MNHAPTSGVQVAEYGPVHPRTTQAWKQQVRPQALHVASLLQRAMQEREVDPKNHGDHSKEIKVEHIR